MPDGRDVTELLQRFQSGDAAAGERALAAVYDELHGAARRLMSRERDGHTLQPTALVHEAWLRLVAQAGHGAEALDRDGFVAIAARVMRQVLVDHARARASDKRGGDRERQPLDDALEALEGSGVDVLDLHTSLERLSVQDEQLARVVELRFFAGMTLEETGRALGISIKQVRRAWELAQAWLQRDMGGAE